MDESVRDILAAEMASIARALEVAHLVSCSHAQNLLLVVDNMQAVMITQTIVKRAEVVQTRAYWPVLLTRADQ